MNVSPKDPLADYAPPCDIEAETNTVAAMAIEQPAIDAAVSLITAADFYRIDNRYIFEAICALSHRGEPVDLFTVKTELERESRLAAMGGLPYLTGIMDRLPTAANINFYAARVAECAQRRRLIDAAMATIAMARSDGRKVADITDRALSLLSAVPSAQSVAGSELIREPLRRVWDMAEDQAESGGGMTGLPTGFRLWDAKTGGLQPSDLVVIAARPSMGKTSMALSIAEHAAVTLNNPVVIFSLEMSSEQLARRMVCSRAEVSSHNFRSGALPAEDWDRVNKFYRDSYDLPIHIGAQTDNTASQMRRECRRIAHGGGLSLIVVDYLQLMGGDAGRRVDNRTQEVTANIRALKQLAREFRIPVVVLSQLSRKVEERTNKRPLLSDLYESGGIEAEADMVCFLYREAYYQQKAEMGEGKDTDGPPVIEETELIIAKHRNGPTGMVKLGFIPQFASFQDWQDDGF